MNREERLGTAPIWRLMFSMGIPTFIGQLVNLLYNIVDRIFIGHIPGSGSSALTGVGLCLPLLSLIAAFSMLAGTGGAPRAAIALGKGDRERAEKVLANSFSMLLVFTAVLTVLFFFIKKPFLYAFGASDATYPYAEDYLNIYLCGTLFVMLVLGLNSFIAAQGQAKVAMVSVLVGAVTNLILDPIFIFAMKLGVKGAAYATILAQGVSAAWVLQFLFSGKATLRIKPALMAPDWQIIGSIVSLGISPFIIAATESLISVVFNRQALIYGNDLYVGAVTVLHSIRQMIFTPLHGFTQGVQPVISYNYGAGNRERVKTTCRRLNAICFSFALLLTVPCLLFPARVSSIFTDDAALVAICAKVVPLYMAGSLVFGVQSGAQASFMALGQAKHSLCFALLRKVILLTPLALLLPALTGSVYSLFAAESISDTVSATICAIVFALSLKRILADKPV